MRLLSAVVGAAAVTMLVAGCSSPARQALAPAQDAQAAVASSSLAWQQYTAGSTLPTVAITTLEDMLAALAESESTLAELPVTGSSDAETALEAVRESSDAVAAALSAVKDGGGAAGIGAGLSRAADDIGAAVEDLE